MSHGQSRWPVAAAAVLLGLGVVSVAFGLFLVAQGLTRDDSDGMGYGILAAFIGAVITTFGGLAALSGIGVWRHTDWARYLGLVVAGIGTVISGIVLPTAFNTVYGSSGEFGEVTVALGPSPTSIIIGLSFFPFLFVLVGLILGGRHFKPAPAASAPDAVTPPTPS